MTGSRTSWSTPEIDRISRHSVLVDAGSGLVVLPWRRRDGLMARLRRDTLDARLAAGEPPEHERLLAVRAAQITGPAARQRLARSWDDVVARARRPAFPGDPHAPVARAQLDAAVGEIRLLTDVLRAGRPVSAQGVALSTALLTTPTSPVYRRGADPGDLAAALGRAAREL